MSTRDASAREFYARCGPAEVRHSLICRPRIAVDGLMDPVDVRRNTRDDALSTRLEAKTVDANDSPCVLLIFACQWAATITLTTQHNSLTSVYDFVYSLIACRCYLQLLNTNCVLKTGKTLFFRNSTNCHYVTML